MNSNYLKGQFPETYQKFFSGHDVVVSGCNVLPWSTFWYHNDTMRIKQKVPTKSYIGIKFVNSPGVRFKELLFFDAFSGAFEYLPFSSFLDNICSLKIFVEEHISSNGIDRGIEISFLSENPRGHGLGSVGVFFGVLSFSLGIITDLISPEDINDYSKFVSSNYFSYLINLGFELESIERNGKTTGTNIYSTFINSGLPVIGIKSNRENLNTFYKLEDFLEISSSIDYIPVDYGVIYSGESSRFNETIHIYDSYVSKYNSLYSFFQKKFEKKGFLTNNILKDLESFEIFISFFMILNFKLLSGFYDIFNNLFDELSTTKFINSIKDINDFVIILEHENSTINLIVNLFHKFKSFEHEDIGIFPIDSTKLGGSFVFVLKYNKSRDTIERVFDYLKATGYGKIYLEYASWIDGYCSDGVIIEQFIQKNIVSRYVEEGNYFFKDIYGNTNIGLLDDLLESSLKGLLLDTTSNKILLNGNKLTSKDLHSQNATIEILEVLIDNLGEFVSSKEFPVSIYSKSKNAMVGKIILPLIKLLKDNGYNIDIECKGSLVEFYVKLDSCDINIGIIKKIL